MPLFLKKKRGLQMLYEVKKILRLRTILLLLACNVFSCALFFVQNRGVENASNTETLKELYEKVGGELTPERAAQIEQLKRDTDEVLARESEMEQRYNIGEIDVDTYMEYRDSYHLMNSRKDAVDLVFEQYEEKRENGGWMLFDGYYCRWLDPQRRPWGLILSVFLTAVLLGSCEPPGLLKVLQVTRKGKNGIFREKLRTAAIFAVLLTILYAAEEYGISCSFYQPPYLNAPVQSISCLANVRLSISIGQWIFLTAGIRSAMAALFSGVVCVLCSALSVGLRKEA